MTADGPEITMIAAMARNRVIGREGSLPWRLPADMRHFVNTTRGLPVITGRRNFEDIGRALPGRHTIVLTRQPGFRAPGCTVVGDIRAALAAAGRAGEVMIIGGETIYRQFLPRATRLELTLVDTDIDGDCHFPRLDPADWSALRRSHREPDERNPMGMTFLQLVRI